MVIELDRSDIEKAIRKYVVDEIISYSSKDDYDIKITQAKSAKASVSLVAVNVDITE